MILIFFKSITQQNMRRSCIIGHAAVYEVGLSLARGSEEQMTWRGSSGPNTVYYLSSINAHWRQNAMLRAPIPRWKKVDFRNVLKVRINFVLKMLTILL